MIQAALESLEDKDPFCLMCGPGPMMNLGLKLLTAERIPE
jgi:hypothetical protein